MTVAQPGSHNHRRIAAIALGFAIAVSLGGIPARPAAAMTCVGERVYMAAPVVELIDGPGDPVGEQMWWDEKSGTYEAFIQSTSHVTIGGVGSDGASYDLEKIP